MGARLAHMAPLSNDAGTVRVEKVHAEVVAGQRNQQRQRGGGGLEMDRILT